MVVALATTNYVSSYADESKVQYDQSSYSTVGKNSHLVHVKQTKAQSHQSRTVIPMHVYVLYIHCVCLVCACVFGERVCVCVCVRVCVCGGGGE